MTTGKSVKGRIARVISSTDIVTKIPINTTNKRYWDRVRGRLELSNNSEKLLRNEPEP